MSAKQYEFDPAVITVKQGTHVRFVITATARDHGFELQAYDINQHLKKAVPTMLELVADKVVAFPFERSEFCALGHGRIKGKLVVEVASVSKNP